MVQLMPRHNVSFSFPPSSHLPARRLCSLRPPSSHWIHPTIHPSPPARSLPSNNPQPPRFSSSLASSTLRSLQRSPPPSAQAFCSVTIIYQDPWPQQLDTEATQAVKPRKLSFKLFKLQVSSGSLGTLISFTSQHAHLLGLSLDSLSSKMAIKSHHVTFILIFRADADTLLGCMCEWHSCR
ncbi:hypothetical protein C8R45DRAFT_120082 [Mycena sanguinolenta]|nr:hypothetical protein C8R45DRAFT_120082 [Mycena sanguinolenta]